jgi:hypothetical protein
MGECSCVRSQLSRAGCSLPIRLLSMQFDVLCLFDCLILLQLHSMHQLSMSSTTCQRCYPRPLSAPGLLSQRSALLL